VRPWAPQRSQDGEFEQAGAELLGLRSAAADAECVTLLCDCLHTLGLDEVRVALGNVAFYEALIASLGLEQDDRAALLEALADRDYPLVESIAGKAHLGDEGRRALQRALELAGTRDAVAQARKLATTPAVDQAIDHMVEVRDLVAEAGFEDVIVFDFALFQDLGYYTGLTFEAYAPGLGLPVASGGRYDGLLARFDWDQPAVGFAIGLDRVHAALEETSLLPSAGAPLLSFAGGLSEPARAAELRRLGWRVEALPDDAVVRPPCLRRDGGRYRLELAGAETAGGWRDVLRALEQS
jgi:ATP phosphoribosyltransferase regulatory subunit